MTIFDLLNIEAPLYVVCRYRIVVQVYLMERLGKGFKHESMDTWLLIGDLCDASCLLRRRFGCAYLMLDPLPWNINAINAKLSIRGCKQISREHLEALAR